MQLLDRLLPTASILQLDTLEVDDLHRRIVVSLTCIQSDTRCPGCQIPSTRLHSHYGRTVQDLPWADWAIRLHLGVRKFRCTNVACARKIFCERLPAVVPPWGRRSLRLQQRQRRIGLALGGQAGHRLSAHLDLSTSRNTLLRLIRSTPDREVTTPTVLGLDDWAKRRGRSYGTIC